MIAPTDLRVGNYILDSECEPYYFKVEEIRKHVGYEVWAVYRNGSIKSKEVEGIPLTEDILLKCGFEEWDKKMFANDVINLKQNGEGWLYLANQRHVNIFYLHRLQNLIHSLTGEELQVNL